MPPTVDERPILPASENQSQQETMTPLSSLGPDSTAKLSQLGGDRSFQRRLMELGLLPGTPLRVVRRVPMGGVLEIEVRRSRVTLRMSEASQVLVTPLD